MSSIKNNKTILKLPKLILDKAEAKSFYWSKNFYKDKRNKQWLYGIHSCPTHITHVLFVPANTAIFSVKYKKKLTFPELETFI